MGELPDRKGDRTKIALMAVALAVVLVLITFTAFFPDRYGEIREDLEVGDYYVYSSDRYVDVVKITDISETGMLTVSEWINDEESVYETTQEDFISKIKFDKYDNPRVKFIGLVTLNTPQGEKLCRVYNFMLNNYMVDEYSVIYYVAMSGVNWTLVDTSLINGIEWPANDDYDRFKESRGDAE